MSLTLEPCEAVKKLISEWRARAGRYAAARPVRQADTNDHATVVDMAPAVGAISPEFKQYLETMRSVDQAGIKTRKEADEILQAVEPVRVKDASILD